MVILLEEYLLGLILFILGICFIVFNKKIARLIVLDQNRWGFLHYGKKEINGSAIAVISVGLIIIFFSILEFIY